MVYIEKEGLSAELGRKIIEIRKSDMWKSIEKDNTDAVRQVFDNVFPKNDVKAVLIHEQRGLCPIVCGESTWIHIPGWNISYR